MSDVFVGNEGNVEQQQQELGEFLGTASACRVIVHQVANGEIFCNGQQQKRRY